jgi:hypothetical protein
MITAPIGMGKFNIGKGTIGHIVQFILPSSVTFHQSVWEGANVHIPKPAPGTIETLTCIVVRVYGREHEVFIEELGPGLILVFPIKQDMNLSCLKNNNLQGQARCTQLPITVIISMVVWLQD